MNRRDFIRTASLAATGAMIATTAFAAGSTFPTVRVPMKQRKFRSAAVEATIARVKAVAADPEIGWLFENCFPNTLDTTVEFEMRNGLPDTYVITGDIDAMWLRDSSAQVWPYLRLLHEDRELQQHGGDLGHRHAAQHQ